MTSVTAPPALHHPRRARMGVVRLWARRGVQWIVLLILAAWTLFPILMTLSVSLKTRAGVATDPGLIPGNPTLDGYLSVIQQQGFKGAFLNSVLVGIGT